MAALGRDRLQRAIETTCALDLTGVHLMNAAAEAEQAAAGRGADADDLRLRHPHGAIHGIGSPEGETHATLADETIPSAPPSPIDTRKNPRPYPN